jgi:hypothetical protein
MFATKTRQGEDAIAGDCGEACERALDAGLGVAIVGVSGGFVAGGGRGSGARASSQVSRPAFNADGSVCA